MTESMPRIDATAEPPQALPRVSLGALPLSQWHTIAAFTLVLTFAAAIRFIDLDHLTFRIDELYTLLYSRQSWVDVAGLNGYYDSHPPLYTVLAEIGRAGTGELIIDDAVLTYLGPRQKPPES